MTPTKRTNYPYDCPLLLSKEDVIKFRDANISLAEIAAMLREVKDMTADNHRTLRGYNGDDGLIARLTRLEEHLNEVTETVDTLKDVPNRLAVVDALKDVPAVIAEWKRYPSLTWLVRHKPREMALVTACVVALSVFIGFPGTYVAERLQFAIELLFTKWLKL
jgi:DNA-binding transcriptional MerR regulator